LDASQIHETAQRATAGFVYTFYSYKGGVGRSMALVNIGVLMALRGHRVLLVDWDLEAPGLESFFQKTANISSDPSETPGVVDLLEARSKGSTFEWRNCLLKVQVPTASFDVISAGRKSPDYRNRVQQLNWDTLFREHRVGNYINELRDEWRKSYDFVLIDSRTGITDIGDICTVLLPDVLILLFVTNRQNMDGIRSIMERATAARKKLPVDRSKLLGVPIPARDEVYNEYDKSLEWREIFASNLGYLYKEWLPKEVTPSDALNRLFIPYVTHWSFGERIPVLESERELHDPTTIGNAYARIATLLVNRLDWLALDTAASPEEFHGTRVELNRVRDQAEMARNAERSAIAQLEAEKTQARKLRMRMMTAALVMVVLLLTMIATSALYFYQKTRREAEAQLRALTQKQAELLDELKKQSDAGKKALQQKQQK
jgi:cellulose biosynthesis protein BcsQ